MRYRRLGKTGAEVSVIGYGAGPLGNEYGTVEDETAERSVRAAIDAGINFFDTAPYYGRTLSESRLGKALGNRRKDVLIATKCARFDYRGFDFSAARVHSAVDESLARLCTDYIDLYQVHDIEFTTAEQVLEETLPALRELQHAGKVRWIGITGLPVEMLFRVAEAFDIDTVLSYCHYNLLNREMQDVLFPLAAERDIGLINASPLHMGILSKPGPQDWHPAPDDVKVAGRRMAEVCRERGAELSAVALRYALEQTAVATTLVGMERPELVQANAAVLEQALDTELLSELHTIAAPVLNRTWHEGLPQNAPSSLSAS